MSKLLEEVLASIVKEIEPAANAAAARILASMEKSVGDQCRAIAIRLDGIEGRLTAIENQQRNGMQLQ